MVSCPECEGIHVVMDHETNSEYCEECACLIASTNSYTEQSFQTYEQKLLTSLYTAQKYKSYSNRQAFSQNNSGIDKFNLQSIRKKTRTMASELSLKNCFTEQVLSLYRTYKKNITKKTPNKRINQKKFVQAAFVLITKNYHNNDYINSFTNTCKELGLDSKTTRKYYFNLEQLVRTKQTDMFVEFDATLNTFLKKSAHSVEINDKDKIENLENKCNVIYTVLKYNLNTEIQILCLYLMGVVWTKYQDNRRSPEFVLKEQENEVILKLAEIFKVDIEFLKNNLVYLKKNIRDKLQESYKYAIFLTNRTLYVELDHLYEMGKIGACKEKQEITRKGPIFVSETKDIEEEAVKYLI